MTGHDLELNESVPDLVVERGGPPPVPPPLAPGSPSQPAAVSRRALAIALAVLFGPSSVALIVRLVTSRDPWSPIWQLWIVAIIALFAAVWFLDRTDKLKAAHTAAGIGSLRDLEDETRPLVIAIGLALIGEFLVVASFEVWMGVALTGLLVAWGLLCFLPPLRRMGGSSPIWVACSPAAAFALVSDPHSWVQWTPEIEMVEPTQMPADIGTIVHSRFRIDGRLLEGDDRVVVFDPPWRCGSETLNVGGTGVDLYEMAASDGGTLIKYTFRTFVPPEVAMFGGVFRGDFFKKRWKTKMKRIKQLLEDGAAGSV